MKPLRLGRWACPRSSLLTHNDWSADLISWFRYNGGKEMSTVANVERRIRRIEGFRMRILHLTGADVRGDRAGLPQYGYHRAAENDITVETWKTIRFRPSFPGFEVAVVDARGNSVQGNTKLETVRATYLARKI